ncbi:hypothetical protein UG55_1007198 [Frankia sp. EI5c]|uniref:hypothetical protein n=1 Tax=Frankia sp. EI5c TaxID=683316 RepID=UPI0007C3BCB2|nr:hypothetical protein [Frankia sp. EI5c]OAA27870.1 hypothetical protein UG55_1007198 [Frankia sp. EI5c]
MTSWRTAFGPLTGGAGRGGGAGWAGRGRWWKALGLAGVVGVAAGGAALARSERARRAYTPDEVRARLLARHSEAAGVGADPADGARPGPA